MSGIDIENLREWVGTEETREDIVRPVAVAQFRQTFEGLLCETEGQGVPPGFHWTLFPPLAPTSDLGEDGHPFRANGLPHMPLPSRMWAGGEVTFLAPLLPGETVVRKSRVEAIDLKSGRNGALIFVTLMQDYSSAGRSLIAEKQTIVYRELSKPAPPPPQEAGPASAGQPFNTDTRLLFRYSALTFNAHRIHYDVEYAREAEGYPDLVVHGPLQATLLMNHAARTQGQQRFTFSYRGLSPLYVGQPGHLCTGENGEVWVERQPGDMTMRGTFRAL